jgi:hypothetical protein
MVAQRTLELAGLGLSILLLLRFTPPAIRSWRIYAGVRKRRPVDAGPLSIAPPGAVAAILGELARLGFNRIGERSLRLPDGTSRFEWLVSDEPGTTYVAVVESRFLGALMACYSAFPDGAWAQTNFPRGEIINRRDYVARFVNTTVDDAVATHRQLIAAARAAHGVPRPVQTMADAQRMDDEYRTRHGGVTLRRLTFSTMTPALASAGLAVICGLLVLLDR